MTNVLLFKEKQRFTQWWLWGILLLINPIFIGLLIANWNSPGALGWLLGLALNILLTVFFFIFSLSTEIRSDGIYVKVFPIHLKYVHFSWGKIHDAYVRKYSPITEYGGWGVRYSLSGQGKAYNISGDQGIQLVLIDGSKLLIGTKKPEEVALILKEKKLNPG